MDISLLSLIDLVRNISLALFAISTWYLAREERRTRILFNLSLATEDRSLYGLSETIIELRDTKGIKKKMQEQISPQDLCRLETKIDRLRKLDYIRNLSIALFSLFVLIEIAVFAYYSLVSFLN
jgi:hypothetical protein